MHITAHATTAADTTTATLRKSEATSATTNQATFNIHIQLCLRMLNTLLYEI